MTNTRNDLRQGTLWKQILFFSLPIAATSMLQQLFNSADVAVVGRFSAQKDLALAAVGSTSSVVNLFITIITGLAVGANVVIARSIGASDEKRARQAVHTALILSLLCGAILLVLGECIALPLLEIMDTPSDIIGLAGKYLRIYMLGVEELNVTSYHHQGIRELAPSLTPMAWAEDGLVEAACLPTVRFAWAVQWNPELTYQTDEDSRDLFKALVKAAGERL